MRIRDRRGLTAGVCALVLTASLAAACAAEERAGERTGLVEIGREAPEVALASSDGGRYVLAERRGEGPTVLVFFRGTW